MSSKVVEKESAERGLAASIALSTSSPLIKDSEHRLDLLLFMGKIRSRLSINWLRSCHPSIDGAVHAVLDASMAEIMLQKARSGSECGQSTEERIWLLSPVSEYFRLQAPPSASSFSNFYLTFASTQVWQSLIFGWWISSCSTWLQTRYSRTWHHHSIRLCTTTSRV